MVMKKITLASLLFISSTAIFAQDGKAQKDSTSTPSYNRWTIEASVGQSKGVRPYAPGYYSSSPNKFLGGFQANSFTLGTRYMISPKFGIKGAFSYESLKNVNSNGSLPFEMQQIGVSIQGVVNASRLFNIEESISRFGLLFHAGIKIDQMKSKTPNVIENDHNYGVTEYNGGLIVGVTPQFRLSSKLAVYLDVAVQNSYRQHFNFDGSYSEPSNNLNGQLISTSLGLTYSLGNGDLHGDWAVVENKNLEEINALDKRIGDLETMMDDSDKDGVPDYLDSENNSIAGVAVDTKGRMVDINRNGVPDELEKYLDDSFATKGSSGNNSEVVKRLVNEGYITTYFDFNKTQPTNVSTEGIDFILTYLRNNPNSSVDIIGHADEIGQTDRNEKLAKTRAEAVKNILVKAGVDGSRLNTFSSGEDSSVDVNSAGARKLVRRVTFRIK
jgi:OOP family OmpA-OmpF porin